MNLNGLIIGIITFLIIGCFHPVVIKCEYYFGKKIWPVFLAAGILGIVLSLFVDSLILSCITKPMNNIVFYTYTKNRAFVKSQITLHTALYG